VAEFFPCPRRSSTELRLQIQAVHQSEFVWCAEAARCFLIGHTYDRLHVVQNDGSDVVGQIVIEIRCTGQLAPFTSLNARARKRWRTTVQSDRNSRNAVTARASSILGGFLIHWPLFLGVVALSITASAGVGWVMSRFRVIFGTTAVRGMLPGAAPV
jgi:hypothetical protein